METTTKILSGIISVLLLYTGYNFIPEETDTHVCIVDDIVEMSEYCDRLSSTGRTCYPTIDTTKGKKLCEYEWLRIDRSDIVEPEAIFKPSTTNNGDDIEECTNKGCR